MLDTETLESFDREEAREEASGATQFVRASAAQVYHRLKHDFEFFINFFLPGQLDLGIPAFHFLVWNYLTELQKERVLLAIPRDHAKTTLAKLAVVYYFLFTNYRFCVYLSNTNAIAKGACKDIIEFLKSENFRAVFGDINIIKESENDSLWIFEINIPGKTRPKRCILRAIGQGQQMRGINIDNQRPDVAVLDDVEDLDNTSTELQQKKLDEWVFGTFLKALARKEKRKVLWLGNMLRKTSLLARLSKMERWNPVVFGSIIEDSVTGVLEALWPGKWTVDALIDDFNESKELGLVESWMCEMMNMPGHGKNGFTADQINYQATPGGNQIRAAWITVDPAFGLKDINDKTAIVVHVLPENGCPMIVDYVHDHLDETQMFDTCVLLAQKWNAWVWGIEAVAAQKVLLTLFSVLKIVRGVQTPIDLIELTAGRGDPKIGRIKALVSLMADGEYAVFEDDFEFTNQLIELDLSKKDQKDDLVDAAAYGPAMLDLYESHLIEFYQDRPFEKQTSDRWGMEVASV